MKVPPQIIPEIYDHAKNVYENKLTLTNAKKLLYSKYELNENTARDFINNFRYLMDGILFHRKLSATSITYFFEHIYSDYGPQRLSNALKALKLHIEYHENIQKVSMHKMGEIYLKFLTIPIVTLDEFEQEEIVQEIKSQQKTKEEIANELNNLKPTDPEMIIINSKSYKRDNRTVAQIKILRDFKCQFPNCGHQIKKKDGTFYIEAAHIEPKHRKGRETPDNIMLVCPNHHKEFDYGKLEIILHNKDKVNFKLNEQEYTILLKIK